MSEAPAIPVRAGHPRFGSAEHLAALADAVADPDWEFDPYDPEDLSRCGAWGPGGECYREAGHLDDGHPISLHVSYDSDYYKAWPVGWKSPETRLNAVLDPSFGAQMGGSQEFRDGVKAALALVRGVLKP